ncbi:MAG: M23 family metallopeptidase [Proteobacteria bacterium]|nr:M23 family metallopeptidase [Pseudomonadota bacterium]
MAWFKLFLICLTFLLPLSIKGDELTYIWPSLGTISSGYGKRYGRFHPGIDIADDKGRAVRATESGKVVFSGNRRVYGRTIVIDHGNGIESVYGHNARLYVKKGMSVVQGQKIAKMGSTGRSTGIHLHFEIKVNGKIVDPRKYLESR